MHKLLSPKHMLTVCRRWDRDRRDAIQTAWFNGAGYEAWENVWGIWAGISTRDSAALKLLLQELVKQFLLDIHVADNTASFMP